MTRPWRQLLGRLRAADDGAAAVEFALILPIMLFVYVGTLEAGSLISMDRRVQSVAGALGDLVARSDTTIPAATLTDYFQAAGGIMTPYSPSTLSQTVTQVRVNADGTTVVWSWQYAGNQLTAGSHATGDDYPLPEAMINVARDGSRDTFVIVAETRYSYLPLYGIVFDKPIELHRQNFFMPRFGGDITVN